MFSSRSEDRVALLQQLGTLEPGSGGLLGRFRTWTCGLRHGVRASCTGRARATTSLLVVLFLFTLKSFAVLFSVTWLNRMLLWATPAVVMVFAGAVAWQCAGDLIGSSGLEWSGEDARAPGIFSAVLQYEGDTVVMTPLDDLPRGWTETPRAVPTVNPLIHERIKQLNERTRICSRRVWEDTYLVDLFGSEVAERMRPAMEQCCVCVSDIGMSEQIRGLGCGHIFHLTCLAEVFMRDSSMELACPLCRVHLSQQRSFRDWEPDDSPVSG